MHDRKGKVNPNFLINIVTKAFGVLRSRSYATVKYVGAHLDFTELLAERKFQLKYPLAVGEVGLISCWGIGDTLIVAGLAHQLVTNGTAKRVVLLVKPSHRYIAELFPAVFKTYALDNAVHYLDHDLNALNFSKNFLKNNKYIYAHFFNREMVELMGVKGINAMDCYRAVLKIPSDTTLEVTKPITESEMATAKELLRQNNLTEGKTILLATDANSIPTLAYNFWLQLIERLTAIGYDVALNSNAFTFPANPKVKTIDVQLSEVIPFALAAGNVIAVRSGLCDLLSVYNVNLVVLYPDIKVNKGYLIDSYAITKMWQSENIKEMQVALPNEAASPIDYSGDITDIVGSLK